MLKIRMLSISSAYLTNSKQALSRFYCALGILQTFQKTSLVFSLSFGPWSGDYI